MSPPKRKRSPDVIRKRMENSLPWSISRLLAQILGRKRRPPSRR